MEDLFAFCRAIPRDANFQVGLQQFIITAPLYTGSFIHMYPSTAVLRVLNASQSNQEKSFPLGICVK